ncbi:unnamed protein product [Adineta ricciae]|uniref:Uncharacterized protein n=1 Tax=Adineta ricciae TaxID=249248 RepID=A0A815WBW7_ADIRI|nr:unnamed protein product [Adineta ricciae]CAF1540035.1 unnamed protein product [Adineta ricciae]
MDLVLEPITPVISRKLPTPINSPRSLTDEQYFTPQLRVRNRQVSTESESTTSNISSVSSDYESDENSNSTDRASTPASRHVHFSSSVPLSIEIQVSIENDEAEFFAVAVPSESTDCINELPQPSVRKRDKIRAAFHKKFHRVHSDTTNTSTHDWNEVLAKTIVSIHRDMEDIITDLDEAPTHITNNPTSCSSEQILSKPHLSFAERQRGKLQLIRMAQMLQPPNLLTCALRESPYAYTDIIVPDNNALLRLKKNFPFDNLLIQHQPFQHRKFRYRTQRSLLRIRHDLKKLKRDLYGSETFKSHKELPSLFVQNYRNHLEQALHEVRQQIAEYDRIHSTNDHNRPSISQIVAKMKRIDPDVKAQIDDYRTKLRPIEYIDKNAKRELISAPFIPHRPAYCPDRLRKETSKNIKDESDQLLDKRFDPTTFVDLNQEAKEFFDDDLPFWDRPEGKRLPVVPHSSPRRLSHLELLPPKVGVWDRLVYSFKFQQKLLRLAESQKGI